ncbi:hypothetical protein ACIQWN_32340 [Streptomyces vinaceus]|uniref:hypothetical protein n=1 Tax=Streptomyces vinaceus TaxID=1960 RepID=UPI0038261C90
MVLTAVMVRLVGFAVCGAVLVALCLARTGAPTGGPLTHDVDRLGTNAPVSLVHELRPAHELPTTP